MRRPAYNWKFIMGVAVISALGGLLFGYDFVVIGGAKPFYEPYFGITGNPSMQGWVMSCALAGCIAGSMAAGWMSDRYGRKRLLILSAILFIATSLGTGSAGSIGEFISYRILGGVGIGLASNLSPVYIAEITPGKYRGALVSINQLTIVLGILAAQVVNWRIAEPVPADATIDYILNSWNGHTGWRWMFYACAVPATFFFILMWLVPESPRWLAKNPAGREKVYRTFLRIGGPAYAENELSAVIESLNSGKAETGFRELRRPGILKVLVLGVVLAVFQQWCGINVIFNYAQEVFAGAGYSVSDILFNIVITGSVNLAFTFAGIFTVDRLGRKTLMLLGAGGLTLIFLAAGTMYFLHVQGLPLLIMVVAAIACFAMSLGPVTWVVLSEIFPNRIRGAGMAISTFSLWSACFILTYTFPLLNNALNVSGTFWLYGIICITGFFFIMRKLPETKGKTLEQIEKEITKETSF